MPKNWLDWSDWKGKSYEPEHPLSKHIPRGMKGADAVKEALRTGRLPVMQDAPRQPTDEEMFGHLVKSEEEIKKSEDTWNNTIKKWYKDTSSPIDKRNKSPIEDREWKPGKSFNSMMTEEEMIERNQDIVDRKTLSDLK